MTEYTDLIVRLPKNIVEKYFERRLSKNASNIALKPTEEYLNTFRDWYKDSYPVDAYIKKELGFGVLRIIEEDGNSVTIEDDLNDLCDCVSLITPEFLMKFFKEIDFDFAIEGHSIESDTYSQEYYRFRDGKTVLEYPHYIDSKSNGRSCLEPYFQELKDKETEEMNKDENKVIENASRDLFDLLNTLGMIDEEEYSLEEFEKIRESLPETMNFVSDLFTNNDCNTIEKLLVNILYKK